MAATRPMVLDDLARIRWAMEPALHPSGAAVAYVSSGPDPEEDGLGYDVHVVEGPGSPGRVFEHRARRPRWSPDGGRIALLRRSGHRWVVGCRSIDGDEVAVPSPPGDVVDLQWAPDGGTLLACTTEPGERPGEDRPYPVRSSPDWLAPERRRVWILTPGAGARPVDDGMRGVTAACWSPDGAHLGLVSDVGVDRDVSLASGVWRYSVGSGAAECLVPPATPIHALAWSPDGRSIAYVAHARDNSASALSDLWVLDLETLTRHRRGVELDRSVGFPVRGDDERAIGTPILEWTEDSRFVLAVYADAGRSRLARFGPDGTWEDVVDDDRCVLEFSSGSAGVAISWSDPATPGEVSLVDGPSGVDRRVSATGDALMSGIAVSPTTTVTVTASDGVEVEGWLTVPPGHGPATPLVLQVHGGPHHAVGARFSFDAQRLAGLGMAVLRANPRGSHGYGQAFADGNLGDWGGRDLADLIDLVDEAVTVAGLDPTGVAIIGESYGGYMAAWALATTGRFAAGVVENGIADFLSSAGGPVGETFWRSEMAGAPWENPQRYLERSVITRIDGVDAPVLVIHCEADTTCPVAHGEAIHAALRASGREVGFLRVPGEGHFFNVFGTLSRRLGRTAHLDDFLVGHLLSTTPNQEPVREETPA